jgi:hypothetical protein
MEPTPIGKPRGRARAKDQLALDERVVNDKDLEQALEDRLKAADNRAEVNAVYKRHDREVRAMLDKMDELSVDQPLRIGRFRITKTIREATHVEFDTEPKERVSIALIDS